MAGCDYANARVRAMKSRLLGPRGILELLALPHLGARLDFLKGTEYGEAAAAHLSREPDPLRGAERGLRARLAQDLARIDRFLDGDRAQPLYRALLAFEDGWNLKTILRGMARGEPPDRIFLLLAPTPALDDAALEELARQREAKAVIDLLTTWQSPYALPLQEALPEYLRRGELLALEVALDRWLTHYCEALREVALARQEIPGRRGYPGYMYTDLAGLFERAGKIRGRPGSIAQLPILTMPDDDITHPIPDLTGYITEGQVVLSRELDRKRVFPPIDALPSLSRLMNLGIGAGRTREDHRALADQLYAFYARGRDVRRMEAIVGQAGLGEEERRFLAFADRFELDFLHQGGGRRSIEETLAIGWRLLKDFPAEALTRIKQSLVEQRKVWGIPTPEVTGPRLARSLDARGLSPLGWGFGAIEATQRHEEALEILLEICSREVRLKRLGEEIRKTSRRINALEQSLIPRLDRDIAGVESALEERAREDVVRLKRFKARRDLERSSRRR